MKLFTCMAHADPRKLPILRKVLAAQAGLCEEVHVCVITNIQDPSAIQSIYECAPIGNEKFRLEVYNKDCDKLPSPWLLTWVHKQIMLERFADPTYTHFMCIEDDMEVTATAFRYWVENRDRLRPFNLYPSFLRVEWNFQSQKWAMADSIKGDVFSVSKLPHLQFEDGYGFVNLGRTYQGMFLYDRELMLEHINSPSFDLQKFVPDWQVRVQHVEWPLGLTEAAVFALSHINVPSGCYSRNFLPYYTKYLTVDPCCFVHHLPDKYTNMPESEGVVPHGRVFVGDILVA